MKPPAGRVAREARARGGRPVHWPSLLRAAGARILRRDDEGVEVEFTFPRRAAVVSEANRASHEHWRVRHDRARHQRDHVGAVLAWILPRTDTPVWSIALTRLGKRRLDSDNIVGAFKHVRDGVSDAIGIDDANDVRLAWSYEQQRSSTAGLRVRVVRIGERCVPQRDRCDVPTRGNGRCGLLSPHYTPATTGGRSSSHGRGDQQ